MFDTVLETDPMTHAESPMIFRAPAKLNLSLLVGDSRSDGYHDVHTVMGAIDLFDTLTLRRGQGGLQLECRGLAGLACEDNLVMKAARLLERHVGKPLDVSILLEKAIPAGGGLGGASSDAAYCLMGLNRFLNLGLSVETLAKLGGQLGSDIPFFFEESLAVCTGRGEIVTPVVGACTVWVLLVVPTISVPTAKVYQHYRYDAALYETQQATVEKCVKRQDWNGLIHHGINSLAETCMALYPELNALRRAIVERGVGPVRMSGSGSCLFEVSDSSQQVQQWRQTLQRACLANVAAINVVRFLNQHNPT